MLLSDITGGVAKFLLSHGFHKVWEDAPLPGFVTGTKGRWMWIVSCSPDWREASRGCRRVQNMTHYVCIATPTLSSDVVFAAKHMGYGLILPDETDIRLRPRMLHREPPDQHKAKAALEGKEPLLGGGDGD